MSELSKSNAEYLRQWLRTCPFIPATKKTGIDYLSDTPTEYSVYASPSTLRYRENIWGEEILEDNQEENFIFAAREVYGPEASQNGQNLLFFAQVCAWIIEQNNLRNFPEWNQGTVKSIVPTLTAYPIAIGSNAARYQIQLKVTYRRK